MVKIEFNLFYVQVRTRFSVLKTPGFHGVQKVKYSSDF